MVQVVNLHTNKVARIIGKVENTERFLRIALYQGGYSTKKVKKLPAAAANVNEQREPLTDPTLLCCAFKKHRIYLFRCISTIILLVVHAVPVLMLITFFFYFTCTSGSVYSFRLPFDSAYLHYYKFLSFLYWRGWSGPKICDEQLYSKCIATVLIWSSSTNHACERIINTTQAWLVYTFNAKWKAQ